MSEGHLQPYGPLLCGFPGVELGCKDVVQYMQANKRRRWYVGAALRRRTSTVRGNLPVGS